MTEKIGICDWGIGGIGMYQHLKSLGDFDIVYLSDAGFTPYGKVSEGDLLERWEKVKVFFASKGVYKIAVACNALSTVVVPSDKHFTVVNAAINKVKSLNLKRIGITGGYRTIESNVFKDNFSSPNVEVIQSIGQVLSARVEAGDIDSIEALEDIKKVFEPLQNCDAALLACTHYPVLAQQIKQIFPHLNLIDPAFDLAVLVYKAWFKTLGYNQIVWFTTGDTQQMITAAQICFQQEITNPIKIQL